MLFRDLVRSLMSGDARRPTRQSPRRQPPLSRLSVEPLESRDVPTATLWVGGATVLEGNAGTRNAAVAVTLSQPQGGSVTVNFSTADATAAAGSDYAAASGKLTFAKGETSKTILIPVRGDRVFEYDESFRVQLSNPTKGVNIANGTGYVTITDDEPRVGITDAAVAEGNAGTTAFTFTVGLSAAADLPVTVNYATADGSATAGSDYAAAAGTLTFLPGQTSQTLTVLVNGDSQFEQYESFLLNLSTPSSNAGIAKAVGVGTIVNDDQQISISDASNYGDYSPFTFTVSLAVASDEAVTVDFTTADGTALAGVDYARTSGTLTFAPGVTTMTITVDVLDPTYSDNKYFTVHLSNASTNAPIGNGVATGFWTYYASGSYDPGYDSYSYSYLGWY